MRARKVVTELAAVVLSAVLTACGGINIPNPVPTPKPTPTPIPEPTPPEPQCAGQTHSCWHKPPDSRTWLYACPVFDASGGVVGIINVVGGPAQCPANPNPDPNPTPTPTPTPKPTPTPPPGGDKNCDGDPGVNTGIKDNSYGNAVNEAIKKVTGCEIGSDCNLGDKINQVFFREVIEVLRSMGYCAGQHEPNVTDEIAVAQSRTDRRRSHHIFGGDDSQGPVPPGGTVRKAVWAPGSTREAYQPSGTEPIPPDPTPPTPGACSDPLPPFNWTAETLPDGWGQDEIGKPRWVIECVPHGNVVDCTAKVTPQACDYCAAIGMSPSADGQLRCGCPVRSECPGFKCEEREACEAYLTGGTRLEARNGATCEFANNNPFQFRPSNGNCRLVSIRDPRVFGGWF